MKRHRLIGAFILFITVTAAVAPIAYLLGLAHGAEAEPLVFEPDPAAFVDMTDAIWDCEQFGDFPGLRTIDIAIGCGPGMGLGRKGPASYVPKYGRRLAGAPLQRAMMTAITGDNFVPPAPFDVAAPEAASPLSLALAPGAAGGPPGSRPAITGGVLPFVLPSGPLALNEEEPPPPAVPLPGTSAFMATGLIALGVARWRRRRAQP